MLCRIRASITTVHRSYHPRFIVRRNLVAKASMGRADLQKTIVLRPPEQELFTILREASRHAGLKTIMRCAGGWVRDKLLGKDSVDIDIALDDMLGSRFAAHVSEYLEAQGKDAVRIAVVQANPEQSKHLETAKIRVGKLDIDLVNLRSETYAADAAHRIPEMEFGTPEQDALRRDLTFNALFYNINTGEIEDFTGKGMQDLQAGLVRTPLPAMQTFLDDPLRVLRAIRFAARFDFEMDAELEAAAASAQVRDALLKKVSRERVGAELHGMFNGPAPLRAMQDIQRLQLFPSVFAMHPAASQQLPASYSECCVAVMAAAAGLLNAWRPQIALSAEGRTTALIAALLLPLRGCQVPDGKRTQDVSQDIIMKGIKWKRAYAASTQLIHSRAAELLHAGETLQGLAEQWQESAPSQLRAQLGLAVRQLKEQWPAGMLVACLLPMAEARQLGVDNAQANQQHLQGSPLAAPDAEEVSAARLACCRTLETAVYAFRLDNCWTRKQLLDGKEMAELTGAKGKQIGRLQQQLIAWQLAHPDATQEQARDFIRSQPPP